MTDDRLIALIEEGPPEELSGDDLTAIRGRLARSPALREALLRQLQMEQALHQTVGNFRLPVELLLAKAAAIQATATAAKLFGWGTVTSLLVGIATVGSMVAVSRDRPQPARPVAMAKVVAQEPASPSDVNLLEGPKQHALPLGLVNPKRQSRRQPVGQADVAADLDEVYFADATDAATWRKSLESLQGDVTQRTIDDRAELLLAGAHVLRQGWPDASRLRLKLADHDRFKIHLSHTEAGNSDRTGNRRWPTAPSSLTLEFFAEPEPVWVAWIAARHVNQALPESLALAAHDAGTLAGLGAGTLDVSYHAGRLRLTHGDVDLLAAPLAGPPNQITFEGQAVLQGLAFADGLPALQADVALLDPSMAQPARQQWQVELPPSANWNVLAEGRVELLAEDSQEPAKVVCQLPASNRHEIVIQLEDPLPGTGIVLSDERGATQCRLGFVDSDRANQVCFAIAKGDEPLALPVGPLPLCPPRPWFKLVASEGKVMGWFSCDGAHWSPLFGPQVSVDGGITRFGVYCLPGPGTRSIRVAQFAVKEAAPALASPTELFGQLGARSQVLALRNALRWTMSVPRIR